MEIANDKFIVMGCCSWAMPAWRWIHSLRATGYAGRVVMIMTQVTPDAQQMLETAYGVEVVVRPEPKEFWANIPGQLCMGQWRYFKEVAQNNPDCTILRTDVFDVVFQADPTVPFREKQDITSFGDTEPKFSLGNMDIDTEAVYVSAEGMLNKENSYMMQWA